MNKKDIVFNKVVNEIVDGKHGPSGSAFIPAREFAAKYGVSFVTALKIINSLKESYYLFGSEKKNYVITGQCNKDCNLFSDIPRKNLIGLNVYSISNPFFSNIISNFIQYAKTQGYDTIVMSCNHQLENEEYILKEFIKYGCVGIISFPTNNTLKLKTFYKNYPLPIIFFGKSVESLNFNAIIADNYQSALQVAKKLHSLNYKDFYYLGLDPENETRCKGFIEMLEQLGYNQARNNLCQSSNESIPNKLKVAINNATAENNIAVFCYHDILASYVYTYANSIHKNIPDEIGVVGYDNLSIATLLSPQLTSVSYDFNKFAKIGFSTLIDCINNAHQPTKTTKIQTILNIRKSIKSL